MSGDQFLKYRGGRVGWIHNPRLPCASSDAVTTAAALAGMEPQEASRATTCAEAAELQPASVCTHRGGLTYSSSLQTYVSFLSDELMSQHHFGKKLRERVGERFEGRTHA